MLADMQWRSFEDLVPEGSAHDVAGAHNRVGKAPRAAIPVAASMVSDRVLERGPTRVLAHDRTRADPSYKVFHPRLPNLTLPDA
jgi:hypothetical protein